jgi:hypothetical protein
MSLDELIMKWREKSVIFERKAEALRAVDEVEEAAQCSGASIALRACADQAEKID